MALADGYYRIVNAANTTLAMDVWGGSDSIGANVQLWTRDTDAQLAYVQTDSDGWSIIRFPLTGHVLDNTGNSSAAGANVEVWDDTGVEAMYWRLDAVSGRTVTIDGVSCQLYRIRPKANTRLSVDPEGDKAPAAGDNLWTYADLTDYDNDKNALGQLWAFLPTGTVMPDATCRIVSSVEAISEVASGLYPAGTRAHLVLDVANGVFANGTNVQLYYDLLNNAQAWHISPNGDGTVSIANAASGYVLDADYGGSASNEPHNGSNIQLWGSSGGVNQKWVPVATSDWTTINGVRYPLWTFKISWGSGVAYYLDAFGGNSQPGRNATLWDESGYLGGREWALLPDSYIADDMPVASSVSALVGSDVASLAPIGTSSTALTPCWRGDASSEWQMRWRWRHRDAGWQATARSAWSSWMSPDGSATGDGWGRADRPNVKVRSVRMADGTTVLAMDGGLTIAHGEQRDLVEVEVDVRSLDRSHGSTGAAAHGANASRVITLAKALSLTVGDSAAWAPDGLHVTLSSGIARTGTAWSVTLLRDGRRVGGGTVRGGEVATGGVASVAATIPTDVALASGDVVTLSVSAQSTDGSVANASVTRTVTWDAAGGGLSLDPKVVAVDGYAVRLTPNVAADVRAWCVWGDGCQEFEREDDGSFVILYPLNTAWTLFMTAKSGDKWDTWSRQYSTGGPGAYVWNWGDEWAALSVDIGDAPSESVNYAPVYNAVTLAAGGFERVTMGKAAKGAVSVSGAALESIDGSEWKARIDALETCRFAWFRDNYARLWRVAVIGVSRDSHPSGGQRVKVDMRRTG